MTLDVDYTSLSIEEQNTFLKTILERILDSSALSEEKRDCLEQFDGLPVSKSHSLTVLC